MFFVVGVGCCLLLVWGVVCCWCEVLFVVGVACCLLLVFVVSVGMLVVVLLVLLLVVGLVWEFGGIIVCGEIVGDGGILFVAISI